MSFLNPLYLWGLLGLVVPLAIHLWSRTKVKTIKVGSIKFIRELEPKQTSRVMINEWWLLLLRSLSIIILVLIIAEPQWKIAAKNSPITYIIEPSLLEFEEVISALDSLSDGPMRLLSPGLPEIRDFDRKPLNMKEPRPYYWQLASEMETIATDSIVVFTNAFARGVRGMRPRSGAKVNWIILDPGEPVRQLIGAFQKDGQTQLLTLQSDHQRLSFEKDLVPHNGDILEFNTNKDSLRIRTDWKGKWVPWKPMDTIAVLIAYEDRFEVEKELIGSAYKAISQYLDRHIDVEITKGADSLDLGSFDFVVWLSELPVEKADGNLLLYRPDSLATSLIEEGPRPGIFHLTGALDTENSIKEQLAGHLIKMLNLNENLKSSIASLDRRVLDLEALRPASSGLKTRQRYSKIMATPIWLWLLLGIVLTTERVLARYRKQ